MADVFSMKRNDTRPRYKAQLTQSDPLAPATQIPVDLSTATSVRFLMSKDGSVKVNAPATVTDAVNGRVEYTWIPADTNESGVYLAEWEVSWGGDKQTFPSEGYLTVSITEDLNNA